MPVFGTVRRHGDRSSPHGRTGTCGRDELPPGTPHHCSPAGRPCGVMGSIMREVWGTGRRWMSPFGWPALCAGAAPHPHSLPTRGREVCPAYWMAIVPVTVVPSSPSPLWGGIKGGGRLAPISGLTHLLLC